MRTPHFIRLGQFTDDSKNNTACQTVLQSFVALEGGLSSLQKDTVKIHYGKCRIQCFEAWPILVREDLLCISDVFHKVKFNKSIKVWSKANIFILIVKLKKLKMMFFGDII